MRPLFLAADHRLAAEVGALAAPDADAIAQRAAARLHQIEPAFGNVDDNIARLLIALPGDLRAHQAGVDRRDVDRGHDKTAILRGAIAAAHHAAAEH